MEKHSLLVLGTFSREAWREGREEWKHGFQIEWA